MTTLLLCGCTMSFLKQPGCRNLGRNVVGLPAGRSSSWRSGHINMRAPIGGLLRLGTCPAGRGRACRPNQQVPPYEDACSLNTSNCECHSLHCIEDTLSSRTTSALSAQLLFILRHDPSHQCTPQEQMRIELPYAARTEIHREVTCSSRALASGYR